MAEGNLKFNIAEDRKCSNRNVNHVTIVGGQSRVVDVVRTSRRPSAGGGYKSSVSLVPSLRAVRRGNSTLQSTRLRDTGYSRNRPPARGAGPSTCF
ncbi:unnamed protein product [Arctia plantaginis]|uniref:Uncharacterized protein n=1 Tax=Arctia plantaginis TaxID=874455 RepID=A0A8S1B8S9_ARCPL|nr:unnamed protein product [Arctia plantaginis]CAB3255201.1 unnamed protein product [Arctia plantaginis]